MPQTSMYSSPSPLVGSRNNITNKLQTAADVQFQLLHSSKILFFVSHSLQICTTTNIINCIVIDDYWWCPASYDLTAASYWWTACSCSVGVHEVFRCFILEGAEEDERRQKKGMNREDRKDRSYKEGYQVMERYVWLGDHFLCGCCGFSKIIKKGCNAFWRLKAFFKHLIITLHTPLLPRWCQTQISCDRLCRKKQNRYCKFLKHQLLEKKEIRFNERWKV